MRFTSSTLVSTIMLIGIATNAFAWIPSSSIPASRIVSRLHIQQQNQQQQQNRILSSTAIGSTTEETIETVEAAVVVSTSTPVLVPVPAAIVVLPELAGDYLKAYEMGMEKIGSKIPEKYAKSMTPLLGHFLKEYMIAAQVSQIEYPDDEFTNPYNTVERFCKGAAYAVQYGMPMSPDLYTFDVTHTALQGDQVGYGRVDYYAYGNNFFRHCMDFNRDDPIGTHVLGTDNLQLALEQINNGDNVVFFANHQSEADPQVVSICFEKVGTEYADAAAQMLYVAGHKVTTDVLAIPFSMGRNLICIHSKKHIDSDPETKSKKQKQNLKAMNGLLRKLKEGGSMVWVAPSGGRDRRDITTGTVPIAQFDSKTIDMFRLMGNKSGKATHYYTMAMVSYDLCPPPDTIEAGTGEQRNVRYSPVGIKIGTELVSVGGLESRTDFCINAMNQCTNDYNELQDTLLKYSQSKK